MKPDNTLVSREKWEALILFAQWSGGSNYDNDARKRILAMPDYIDSERDVEVLKDVLFMNNSDDGANYREYVYDPLAKAVINALRIGGE